MAPIDKLIIAPHLDDEILGVGGAMARWAREGRSVAVAVVTRGRPPLYTDEEEDGCREEALAAHRILGVADTCFLDFPAAELDTVAQRELNGALSGLLFACRPREVFLPFLGDVHRDHQLVFRAGMVAVRPGRAGQPLGVYAYETLSETNWNAPFLAPAFSPNHFVDIGESLETKLEAMSCYRSQVQADPHERSLQSLRALAVLRGATVGLRAAEAFVTIRTLS